MVKVDRTSMSVSLESRAPLLDHKLFELMGRMPLQTRFNGQESKLPFRRMLLPELGRAFVDRPKQGFAVPLGKWFRDELRDDLCDTLLGAGGPTASLLPRASVERMIENHHKGSRDQSARLWKLYMLEKWHACHGSTGESKRMCV